MIQYDLSQLSDAPEYFPLRYEGGRWRLVKGYACELPPVHLSIHKATALYLAGRLLARYSDEHNPHVVEGLKKLGEVLPLEAGNQGLRSAEGLRYRKEQAHVTRAVEVVSLGRLQRRGAGALLRLGAARGAESELNPYI